MSYAGVYGPEETCEHDSYRKNCWKCNGTVERFVTELPKHIEHERKLEPYVGYDPPIRERLVPIYEVSCPACKLSREFNSRDEAVAWFTSHVVRVQSIAREWRNSPEIFAEARKRGLLL